MKEYEQIINSSKELERIVNSGVGELSNTKTSFNRKWYSLGLENNEFNTQSDLANKRNIVLRIIDRLVAMIKSIGAKIAEWYQRCKKAILKFFGSGEINSKSIDDRFKELIKDLTPEDIDSIVNNTSQRDKNALAEILNTGYSASFDRLYKEYVRLPDKVRDVKKFSESTEDIALFIKKNEELNQYADKYGIYENIDTSLKKMLAGHGNSIDVIATSENFKEIASLNKNLVDSLEKILQDVPDFVFDKQDNGNQNIQQQQALRSVSDLLKINSAIVLKVNSRMFAVSELMSKIVKHKFKKINLIPH